MAHKRMSLTCFYFVTGTGKERNWREYLRLGTPSNRKMEGDDAEVFHGPTRQSGHTQRFVYPMHTRLLSSLEYSLSTVLCVAVVR